MMMAAQGWTLLQHPVIETKPTRRELHIYCTGYLFVVSYFPQDTSGPKNRTLTQEDALDNIVFMTILEGMFFILFWVIPLLGLIL